MILTLNPIDHCVWFGGWSGIILDSWTTGGWILGDLEQSRDIQIRPDTQQNIPRIMITTITTAIYRQHTGAL